MAGFEIVIIDQFLFKKRREISFATDAWDQSELSSCAWFVLLKCTVESSDMREIVHLQTGQCGNQIGTKVIHEYSQLI